MRNLFTRFESPLKKFGKSKKKPNKTHILSHIESNPFQKRRKRVLLGFLRKFDIKISKEHSLYYVGIILFSLIVLIFVGIFGPYLQINRIEIIRDSSSIDINMAYNSVDSIRGKKIYNLDTEKIAENLMHFQNNIERVDIDVIFPNRIDIHLFSSVGIFSTNIDNKNYILVKNGTFVPNAEGEKLQYIELYGDAQESNEYRDYKKLLSEKYLQQIEKVIQNMKENLLQVQIQSVHYFITERELLVEIQKGAYIIFDLNKDIEPQVEKLVIFNKENGDITEKSYIYVDVRVSNKIFLCDIENEFDCRRNIKNIYGEIKKRELPSSLQKEASF